MSLETLVAVLSIGIPTVNLLASIINNLINQYFELENKKLDLNNSNKTKSLDNFIAHLEDYSLNPTMTNKNAFLSSMSLLYCYYDIDEIDAFNSFFFGTNDDKIDFEEVNKFINSLQKNK